MKRTAVSLLAILPLVVLAQETHLDIKVPSRVAYGFFGSVKKVTTTHSYDMSDRTYKEVRRYDEVGNLESRTKWDSKGKITYFSTNTFNEAGCLVHQRVEDVRAKTTNDYRVVLDMASRKIAFCDRITGEVEVLKYNEAKYFISSTIKEKGQRTRPLSAYQRGTDNQKLFYTRYNEKGHVKYTTAFDWTDQQLKSRTLYTNKEKKSKALNLYEYPKIDEHGNWLQCLMQSLDLNNNRKSEFEKISRRTIEYFEAAPTSEAP